MLPDTIDLDDISQAEPAKPLLKLSDWDASKRFAGIPEPRSWLVEDVILKGKPSLLAAAGGVGKSFLLLELAFKVASFEKLSGNKRFTAFGKLNRGGSAVLLCAEDDEIEIHNRLASIGELPGQGRLIVIPLPDAGGVRPLFEIDPQSRAPATTTTFHNIHAQLKNITNLTLVVFDPLQALCGGLDLNLPQHGQHVCAALAHMASDTGASVIVSHHLRKGGDIKTPDEARDAIRGSGGLVDGVRSAIAVWPDNSDEAKSVCKRLAVDWQRNRVCKMAVVKANFKADLHVKTLVRAEDGLLEDRGFDLFNVTPKPADVIDKLVEEIEGAAERGSPFTKTGINGIYLRHHELSEHFHTYGRQRIEALVQGLLNQKRLAMFNHPTQRKNGSIWLGKPDGVLAIPQSKVGNSVAISGNESMSFEDEKAARN